MRSAADAATLVVPALTDTSMARRLMGQSAQAGARAPEIWELFDSVLNQLEQCIEEPTSAVSSVMPRTEPSKIVPQGNLREIYASSNGDRWTLVFERDRTFVRHEPNLHSGGKTSEIELAAFLASGRGPEQQALLQMLGSLAPH